MANNAAKDTIEKSKLEEILLPLLLKFNRKIVRRFMVQLANSGNIFDIHTLDFELEQMLLAHYDRTSVVFSDNFGIEHNPGEDDNISLALGIFFSAEAIHNSALINNTTGRNMIQSVAVAQLDPLVIESPDRRTLATVSGANLNRKLTGRISGILTSETQLSAESSKLTEAQVLSGVEPSVTGGSSRKAGVTKRWVTVGDNRVRDSHVVADGQIRDINEPFIVGGQFLMVPRDQSRGASLSNVINCRCSSEYDVKELRDARPLTSPLPTSTFIL